jgi:hypothetical protein
VQMTAAVVAMPRTRSNGLMRSLPLK